MNKTTATSRLLLLATALGAPLLQGQVTTFYPGTSPAYKVCISYQYCDELGCVYEAIPGVNVYFSAGKIDFFGGHLHPGGPLPVFKNRITTSGTDGCARSEFTIPLFSGTYTVSTMMLNPPPGFDTQTTTSPFVAISPLLYSVPVVLTDTVHPQSGWLNFIGWYRETMIRNMYYGRGVLQFPTTYTPYILNVLRAGNQQGGWLDSPWVVPYWPASTFTYENHNTGSEFDVQNPVITAQLTALTDSITGSGCHFQTHATFIHVGC